MKIHVLSDLHLESQHFPDYAPAPLVTGDVCILAGDICTISRPWLLTEYFSRIKDQFDKVLYVLGNHEFYRMSYDAALDQALTLCETAGVHLLDTALNTQEFTYKGKTFWGSTLWTDFGEREHERAVEYGLNDYLLIGDFTTDRAYSIYKSTVEKIKWDADVIITHHMPILREHSRFPIGPITYGFCATTLEDKIAASSIKYWLYGHTHDNAHYKVGNTQIMSNQVGYPREPLKMQYDEHLILPLH